MKTKNQRRFCKGRPSKNMQNISGIIAVVCFFLCLIKPLDATPLRLHVEGNQVKDPNGNVVILRGVALIDLGSLEDWKGGALNAVDLITDPNDTQGNSPGWFTKIIRIMIAPPDSVSGWPHPFNADNNDLYDLLRTFVNYCAEKEVYVAIDWHYVANTYDHVAPTSEFWQYMAPRFANDSHVIYELFNEPNNPGASDAARWTSVKNDMQTWIDIIRGYAPDNLIFVGTPNYCRIIGPTATDPVSDVNVVYISHIYPLHWLSSSNQYYRDTITSAVAVHPVILGEWGFSSDPAVSDYITHGDASTYGQPLKEFVEGLKIGSIAWCAGGWDWSPPMFYSNGTLRVGEGEMGGFAKDWLFEVSGAAQTIDLTINKCKVTAGKVSADGNQANRDVFEASGTFASSPLGLDNITQIDVNIVSTDDGNIIYQESNDFSAYYDSTKNKFKYTHRITSGQPGGITTLSMDFTRKTFSLKSKNIDLTGLAAPVRVDITLGNYIMSGEANEVIVNGKSRTATIPTRLMRTYDDTLIVTRARDSNSARDGHDSLSVTGDLAVENMDCDANEPNLVNEDVNIIWGSQTFKLDPNSFRAYRPGRWFKCSKTVADANIGDAGKVTASIDLDKCKYTIAIKDVNLVDTRGVVSFGLQFADFNVAKDVNVTRGY